MKNFVKALFACLIILTSCSVEAEQVDVVVDTYALAYLADSIATDDITVFDISNQAKVKTQHEDIKNKQTIHGARLVMYVHDDNDYALSSIKNSVNIYEDLHSTIDNKNFWLSPKEMIVASEIVYQTMLNTFPNRKDELLYNYNRLLDSLEELDQELKNVSEEALRSSFIITYDDFKYLEEYGITTQVYVVNRDDDEVLTLKEFDNHNNKFINEINNNGINYIANTNNGDGREYNEISKNVDVQIVTLNVLDKKPETGDYITAQYRNIIAIEQLLN